jgi:hypothetical protein
MRSPASPFGSRVDPAAFEERVRQLDHDGVFQVLHPVRKLEDDGQPHSRQHGSAPQDAELAGCCLLDREIGRARLVRGRRKRHEQQREQLPGEQRPEAVLPQLHEPPSPDRVEICLLRDVSPLADVISVGAGSGTAYFARMS